MYAGTTRQIAFRGRLIEYLYDELKFIEEERSQGGNVRARIRTYHSRNRGRKTLRSIIEG
jgi:hypothetical protein